MQKIREKLGGFKGRLHATVNVVYFLCAILGGFKGRLHATGDVVLLVCYTGRV